MLDTVRMFKKDYNNTMLERFAQQKHIVLGK